MTDPITDMFNRIRNAQAVSHLTVSIPFSNLKYEIAKILKKEGFIEATEKKGRKTKKVLEITLKYQTTRSALCDSSEIKKPRHSAIEQKETFEENKTNIMAPVISGLKRISKPGQRIYVGAKEVKSVREGYGIAIISTPKGLLTNKEARKKKVGGEIICEVW